MKQQCLEKFILSTLHLSKFFIVVIYFLYLTLFTLSPIKGMDILESESEIHQPHEKPLNVLEIDDFQDLNDLEMTIVKDTNTNENVPLLLIQPDLLTEQHDDNPLIPYIHRYIINNEQIEESTWTYRMRVGIKVLTTLYGVTGGIPYISASCSAGQGIMFLCISFATGNIISTGGTMVWAGLRLANSLNPVSKEEKEITHSRVFCSALKHIACNVLGILVSIPGTYAVYKYNPDTLKFLAIPGFLNSYILSTLGYYEITNHTYLFQGILSIFQENNEMVIASNELKEKLINHIQNHAIPSILKDSEIRNHLFSENTIPEDITIEDDTNVDTIDTVKVFMKDLISLNFLPNHIEPPERWKGGYPRKIIQYSSLILPFGSAIVNYLLTYELTSSLTNNSTLLSTPFSVTAVIPGFVLDTLLTTATATTIFDTIYNQLRKRNTDNFTSYFYPTLNRIIPFVSVTLAGLSVTASWFVAYDTIEKSELKFLVYILPSMVFICNTIFQSFSIRDLFDDAINYYSAIRQDDKGETSIKISRLEKLKSIISNCVPSIFYDFLNKIKDYT